MKSALGATLAVLALLNGAAFGQGYPVPAQAAVQAQPAYAAQFNPVVQQEMRIRQLEAQLASLSANTGNLGGDGCGCEDCGGGGCGDCDSCGCSSCGSCACGGCGRGGVYVGAEAVWVKPRMEGAEAFNIGSGAGINDQRFSFPFSYGHEVSPRAWAGYVTDGGIGVRGSYFYYSQSDLVTATVPGGQTGFARVVESGSNFSSGIDVAAGNDITANHAISLDVVDFEVTKDLWACDALIRLGGGIRYANMVQRYDAFGGGEFLNSIHDFEGIGPTVSVELNAPFGPHGFALFVRARGAVLLAEADQIILVNGAPTLVRVGAEEVLAIGEGAFGIEYAKGAWFARAGYEGQIWHGAGGPNSTTTDLGLEGLFATLGFWR